MWLVLQDGGKVKSIELEIERIMHRNLPNLHRFSNEKVGLRTDFTNLMKTVLIQEENRHEIKKKKN